MAEKVFKLEIVTPKKIAFSGDVVSFSAPGVVGGFQVLKSHAPFLSNISVGEVKLVDVSGNEIRFAASGGFVEVHDNKVIMLAETAERSDEIDVARAEAARDRARKRLAEKTSGLDPDRARLALFRAMNRLKVADQL
ncbi:MAG: F0F1 ATP synthase subunit epsilon [Ignavibacteriales bacterium]|jgi:F-type H+-transporting ATPase subunit epsilon|nr:F0F1 ATP synthase subunit epsilon [Ignavibacteriales bacterium]